MKKLLLIIMFIFTSTALIQTQSYYKKRWERKQSLTAKVSYTTMRSIYGWDQGPDLGIQIRNKLELGVFAYRRSVANENEKSTFEGLYIDLPLLTIGQLNLSSKGRLGLHDQRFLSFLPTLQLATDVLPKTSLSAGVGVSDRYPVFDFSISFQINSRFHEKF